MSSARIYHNPRCSKSRETLKLLENQANIQIEIVQYLKTPPTVEELLKLCQQLNKKPLEIMRIKETRFKELGLSVKDERSDAQWCELMVDNPILIERPIVVYQEKAAMGRPPEAVIDLF